MLIDAHRDLWMILNLFWWLRFGNYCKLDGPLKVRRTVGFQGISFWQGHRCPSNNPTWFWLNKSCYRGAEVLTPKDPILTLQCEVEWTPIINLGSNFYNVGNCTKHRINTTKTYIYMQPTQKPHWLMFRNVLQSNTKHPKTSHFKKLAPLSQKNTHIYGKSNRNTKKHGVKPRCSNFDKGLWWDSAHFPEIFHPFLRSMWKWKVQDLPKKSMHTPGSLKTKD